MLDRILCRPVLLSLILLSMSVGSRVGADTGPSRKPAVLFVSRRMPMYEGGSFIRTNMARLDKLRYRVAYHSYPDLYAKEPGYPLKFDVVVLLDLPALDLQTDALKPKATALYADLRKLLHSGGGLMVFNAAQRSNMKVVDTLLGGYGAHPLTGCLLEKDPTLAVYDVLSCAYTKEISRHSLCEGVKGFWHPVAGRTGRPTDFDSLRNANTVPFDVDSNWTVLASAAPTTSFQRWGAAQGADDPWLQQERFTRLRSAAPPLVAVRQLGKGKSAEGKGRLAFCGVNSVYSDFHSGNKIYDGLCTGKGLNGQSSDLGRLLMNVLDWLGETSVGSARETISSSDRDSFAVETFRWKETPNVAGRPPREPDMDQFQGVIGVRSRYSGGESSVHEYAEAAKALGIQYLVFLEDFASIKPADFEKLKTECAADSDANLVLIPGIRIQSEHGIWYFGFRKGLTLPEEGFLKPDTRKLAHHLPQPGQYQWARNNGAREQIACGNFRLDDKTPAGIPPEDYNVLNPFISLYTYRNGTLADSMLDTFLKCAGRTEWVSPIAIHLIDSAEELRREWASDHFKTVYLRGRGKGLAAFDEDIGERYGFAPITYVTNGPRIDVWRSNSIDTDRGWWDWKSLPWFIPIAVSSDAGLQEIRVMNGRKVIRRFLPAGAKRFEHTLAMTHHDMRNLVLIVTDAKGRQAISDEQWDKNQLLQLTWCADRNNMLCWSALPAPLAASGSTAGNFPTPSNLEKGGFRENLLPFVNMDRTYLPGFDGQPYRVAHVSPKPTVFAAEGVEGDDRIARDIGRQLSSPDVAIQTAECRLVYDKSVKRVHPWLKGPLVPMELFHADLRYITFSHEAHLPAPVILEGRIKFLKDLSFPASGRPVSLSVLTLISDNAHDGYKKIAIRHTTSDLDAPISYEQGRGASPGSEGPFKRGAFAYFHPGAFGSVGVISLDDNLAHRYGNRFLRVGYDMRGKTVKAGEELVYRLLVFASGFNEPPDTSLPEALQDQLGINRERAVGYTLRTEHGSVTGQEYVLRIDGKRQGFAGEIILPADFSVSLPVVVENLNDKWTSVLYDREKNRLRPLGMHDNKAYCHRAPAERGGKIFIGHPFTLDKSELWLTTVQTGERELTVQVHNPTNNPVAARLTRSPYFDLVACDDFDLNIPAGQTLEYCLTTNAITESSEAETQSDE